MPTRSAENVRFYFGFDEKLARIFFLPIAKRSIFKTKVSTIYFGCSKNTALVGK